MNDAIFSECDKKKVMDANANSAQGMYIAENGNLYFCFGKCRIKVTEHFAEDGRTVTDCLEDFITFTSKSA